MAEYYLIRSNGTLYTIADAALSALDSTELTARLFQDSGITDATAITSDVLEDLTQFSVLKWSDSESVDLSVTVTALPQPQTIISDAIYINDETITGIEAVTAEYGGEPKIAVSFDDMATWYLHNGTEWGLLSDETSGMSVETLTAITTEQWQEKIEGLEKIYLRVALSTADDTVTNIVIDFVN